MLSVLFISLPFACCLSTPSLIAGINLHPPPQQRLAAPPESVLATPSPVISTQTTADCEIVHQAWIEMGGAEGMAPHSKDCCQSAGVVCADSRVIELNWDGKSGAMVSLPGFKKFSKQISLGLAKLELNVLDLSHNQLTGGIPDNLQTLKSLTVLQFNGNSLAGRIPPWLGELPSLELLYLDHNKFFGTIPESLSNLANLKYLALENNFLTGPIPQSFVKLGNLIQLHLLSNNLEGEIPNMSGLASLNWVRVQKNPMLLVNDILSKFPDGIRVEYSP